MDRVIEFDCPRQIGKTHWAVNRFRRFKDKVLLVVPNEDIRRWIIETYKFNNSEQKLIITPRRHYIEIVGRRFELIIIDDVRYIKKKDIHSCLLPYIFEYDGYVIILKTSRKKEEILWEKFL